MDEKQLQALYSEMSSALSLPDYDSFKKLLQSDDSFRKAFYDEASSSLEIGDFDSFNRSFKKKESSVAPSQPAPSTTPSKPEPTEVQISGSVTTPEPQQPVVDQEPVVPEDLKLRYLNVGKGTQYINGLLQSKRSESANKPDVQTAFSEFFQRAKELNQNASKMSRVDFVYDFLSKNTDLQTNNETRDAFISSQYAPASFSTKEDLIKEYSNSEFKDVLTPRQYNALKSLSYGRQSENQMYAKILKDPSSSDADKEMAKMNLEKIGSNIDADAAAKMTQEGMYPTEAINLYNSSKESMVNADNRLRQIEYENPYSSNTFKSIVDRAIKRGVATGGVADILTATSDETGIDVERLAELNRKQQDAKSSLAFDNFYKDPSFENFSKNPIGILTELSLESLAALYYHGATRMAAAGSTGAALGSIVPGIGTAIGAKAGAAVGVGLASLNLEYSSSILEGLSSLGVDITDPEQLKNAFGDEKVMDDLKKTAYAKSVPIALLDAISVGVAGKLTSKAVTTAAKLGTGVAEVGIQSALGATGEAAGQLVSKGKIYSPSDILMEAIGEIGPGSVEVITGTMLESAKKGQPANTKDVVSASRNAGQVKSNIDVAVGAGIITEQQGQSIKSQLDNVSSKLTKVPEGISDDARAEMLPLIDQKNYLNKQLETLDPAFKPEVQNAIKEIDDKILNIFNQEKQKAYATPSIEGVVQEGVPEGGIVQPTRAEAQGQEAPAETNVGNRPVSGEGQVAPGKRLFNEPVPEVADVERKFKEQKGITEPEPAKITSLNVDKSKTIADAYEAMPNSPDDPEVQKAYQAMADETMDQYKMIKDNGVKVEIWEGKGEPYKNSAEMIADVRDNKHMYIFSTEQGFGEQKIGDEQRKQNALLRDSGEKDVNGKPLLINDVFRFVHDYFGHSRLGNSFGAIGEENAWNVHARMYSPLARRAMTTETRGQNSWVNFNKNLRNPDGSMKTKGQPGYIAPAERPFAEQKMGLLPEEFSRIEESYSVKPVKENVKQEVDRIKSLDKTAEDGATFNADGTKYEGGGLIVPAVSLNTTVSELTPEMIEKFISDNKEVASSESAKVGIYKFPNSDRVSIDLNIVAKPEQKSMALEFAKKAGQESLFDLANFENVKTGATGENPMQFSPKQFTEIAKAFSENRMPNVFGITEELQRELVGPDNVESIISKAQKALEKTGVKIELVDNEEDAIKAGGQAARGNQGLFLSEQGKIVIDRSKIGSAIEQGLVVWHEASHPIMNIIRNTNKPLYDAVISGMRKVAKGDEAVRNALKWAKENYQGEDVINDEAIVEAIGRIGSGQININNIEPGFRQKLIDLINKIAKALGFDAVLDSTDIQKFKDLVSKISSSLSEGRDVSEIVGEENIGEIGASFDNPIQLRVADKEFEPVEFKGKYDLSFVSKKDIIDIESLVKEISANGQKVLFWTADQLGRGMYFDNVVNGNHYLDAGPSFALDPENRDKGIIWATGKGENWINDKIKNSDYIFIISGSPQKSKLFNKGVAQITVKRIEAALGKNSFDKFKKNVLEVSKISELNDLLNKYNSFDEMLESPDRKKFLDLIDSQKSKKATPLKKLLDSYNAFVDYDSLRDGFYRENDFKQNDIMLVLKATGYGGESAHSTYQNNVLGSVVGVPDKKINAFDIMPKDIKEKYQREMTRTEQSQAVAPYGAGIREVQASRGGRPEMSRDFKLASFVMRKLAEGAPVSEIISGIASVTGMKPDEIKALVDNPEQWLMDRNPGMTEAQKKNLVERAKVQNIYRGRQYGKPIDRAFVGLEVPEDRVQEYLNKNKIKDKTFVDTVKDFKNKWLDPSRGLPDWVLAIKDFASGAKNIEIAKAVKTIEMLKDEAKKIGFTDWDQFTKALSAVNDVQRFIPNDDTMVPFDAARAFEGRMFTTPDEQLPAVIPDAIKALPESIIPFVYRMRYQIDGLTKDLIGGGYVTPEQAVTLENNLGAYVNRSYKMFNERGWQADKETIKNAIKYIADIKVKELATDLAGVQNLDEVYDKAIEEAKKEVQAIMDKNRNPYFAGKVESRDIGILKERKNIPEPIRKLMGEYTDPGTVFIMTVAKQGALKAASEYLTKLRKFGMGTLFFEENDPKRPAEYSVKIAGEGSETKSPLNNLYTTPDIYEAINAMDPTYNDLTNLWMKLVGAVRWGKTVGSVVTQFKNFESNLGFAVMNGLLFSGKNTQAFKGAGDYVKGQYSKSEITAITEKLIKLNLVGQSVGAREIGAMLGSGDIHDIALDIAVNPEGRWGKQVVKRINIFGAANKAYRMGDDFWKAYAYLNEREAVARGRYDGSSYSDLTTEQQDKVDVESSERVKNTWPTYDRVIEAAKYVSKRAPIFGNFISFQAESLRVLVNTIKMAREDVKDPQMKAHGMRRMAGITSYLALRSAITLAVAEAAGMAAAGILGKVMGDDDEEKRKRAIKNAIPPYARTGDLMVKSTKEPHKFIVYNLSSVDPYGIIPNSLNALTEGREGIFSKTMDPGVPAALTEFFSGFLEPEMTFQAMWSATQNRDAKTGREIIQSSDTDAEALAKAVSYVWSTLEPSTLGLIKRGSDRGWGPELASMLGFRPIDVDLHKSFNYILSDMGKQMENIASDYNRVKFNEKSTQEDKDKAEMDAENKKSFLISKLNEVYRDFIATGADPKVLDEIIRERSTVRKTAYDKNTKNSIKTGVIRPEKLFK